MSLQNNTIYLLTSMIYSRFAIEFSQYTSQHLHKYITVFILLIRSQLVQIKKTRGLL